MTCTDTIFPYTTRFRSGVGGPEAGCGGAVCESGLGADLARPADPSPHRAGTLPVAGRAVAPQAGGQPGRGRRRTMPRCRPGSDLGCGALATDEPDRKRVV